MRKPKSKLLIQLFSEEQQMIVDDLTSIQNMIEKAERSKELVMLTEEDAADIYEKCRIIMEQLGLET